MRGGREDILFYKHDLRLVLENQEKSMIKEIDGYDRDYILKVSVEDLCNHLESKYRVNPVVIQKDKIYIREEGEANIDGRHVYIKGTSITFAIPFDGDGELFCCRGSSFTSSPPRGEVSGNEILVTYDEVDPDATEIKTDFERRVTDIERHIEFVTNDINPFNKSLRAKAKQKIESRRTKLLKDQGIVAALGYPIKQTSGMPQTYSVPEVKKKVVIQKPAVTITPFVPEPALDMKNYEAILKIVSDMVLVIERSPKTFENMKEEDLRQHFLVQLNGHFEGGATGETFNYEGKTDILIRSNGKNIFIAECMYWDGEKSLLDKIEQLLGYTSWRDTKTAILVFNRNVEFSKVVSQIPEVVKKHQNFKRQLEYKSETGYRFTLHHKDDKDREMTLTVLTFNIPKKNP